MHPLHGWENLTRGYRHGDTTFYNNFHRGDDFPVPEGTTVYAPRDARGVLSGNFPQGGITHHLRWNDPLRGPITARFLHLSEILEAEEASEGDPILLTGNTGLSTDPHLHYDLSVGSVDVEDVFNFLDPTLYHNGRSYVFDVDTNTVDWKRVTMWFWEHGCDIHFAQQGIPIEFSEGDRMTGGARIWNQEELKKGNRVPGDYKIWISDGQIVNNYDTLERIAIHEIQHILFADNGFGDIHQREEALSIKGFGSHHEDGLATTITWLTSNMDDMFKLYRDPKDIDEVYAVRNGQAFHVVNPYTLTRGSGVLWAYSPTQHIPVYGGVLNIVEEIALLREK